MVLIYNALWEHSGMNKVQPVHTKYGTDMYAVGKTVWCRRKWRWTGKGYINEEKNRGAVWVRIGGSADAFRLKNQSDWLKN